MPRKQWHFLIRMVFKRLLLKHHFPKSYASYRYVNAHGLRFFKDNYNTNLYFRNLPLLMDEFMLNETILRLLNGEGSVKCSRILRTNSGQSRGVGFARMDSRRAAELVIGRMNGVVLMGCVSPIYVRFADNTSQKQLKEQTRSWTTNEPNNEK
jgi:RNA recognition motif-containing protein